MQKSTIVAAILANLPVEKLQTMRGEGHPSKISQEIIKEFVSGEFQRGFKVF